MKFAKTRTMIDRFLWIHPFHFSRTLPLKIQRLTSLILWNCDPHPLFDWLQKSRSKGRGGGIIIPILLEAERGLSLSLFFWKGKGWYPIILIPIFLKSERGYVLLSILLKVKGVISYYPNLYSSLSRRGGGDQFWIWKLKLKRKLDTFDLT